MIHPRIMNSTSDPSRTADRKANVRTPAYQCTVLLLRIYLWISLGPFWDLFGGPGGSWGGPVGVPGRSWGSWAAQTPEHAILSKFCPPLGAQVGVKLRPGRCQVGARSPPRGPREGFELFFDAFGGHGGSQNVVFVEARIKFSHFQQS